MALDLHRIAGTEPGEGLGAGEERPPETAALLAFPSKKKGAGAGYKNLSEVPQKPLKTVPESDDGGGSPDQSDLERMDLDDE